MRRVAVAGAGMTRFGKWMDKSLKDLGREAVDAAMKQASVDKPQIEAAIVGNATAGLITGQEMIRGQVILREMGFGDIPIINTENACASSSTAFHLAWMYVASGMYDCVLALGVEKLYHEDKRRSFQAIGSAVDVGAMQELIKQTAARGRDKKEPEGAAEKSGGAGESRSMFMDFYAAGAREHMKRYGTTPIEFAKVAVKSHENASLNPYAQYREKYTVEDILASPMVAEPLTRLMCSPIGDGAAALCASAAGAGACAAAPASRWWFLVGLVALMTPTRADATDPYRRARARLPPAPMIPSRTGVWAVDAPAGEPSPASTPRRRPAG